MNNLYEVLSCFEPKIFTWQSWGATVRLFYEKFGGGTMGLFGFYMFLKTVLMENSFLIYFLHMFLTGNSFFMICSENILETIALYISRAHYFHRQQ